MNRWGEVRIEFEDAIIKLRKVPFVPKLGYNLVSTGNLADNGIESQFQRHNLNLNLEGSGKTIGNGSRDRFTGLYVLPSACIQQNGKVMLCMGAWPCRSFIGKRSCKGRYTTNSTVTVHKKKGHQRMVFGESVLNQTIFKNILTSSSKS